MSREEAVETMFGALCEMVAFDSTEDPERARAVTIYMLDAALASGFVVLRSELEQITTADGLACWTHDGGGVEWNGHAVYWISEEGESLNGDLCLECGADLATESHRSGCPYSDTNEDGSPHDGDWIHEEGD